MYGRSLGASAAAGSKSNELPGRLANMCSDRAAVSSPCTNVVVTHQGPGVVYQRQKVQCAASSHHPVPRYVAGCQDGIGETDRGQAGSQERLPCAHSSRDQSHLEAVSPPLGPHGCCCEDNSASTSAHAASTEVSLKSGPVPTERPMGYGAGYQEVVCGPQMVEGAGEHLERQQAGSSPVSAGDYLWIHPLRVGALSTKAGAHSAQSINDVFHNIK